MNNKHCLTCNNTKDLVYFHKDKTTYDGYTSKCKECKQDYNILNKGNISNKHKEHYKIHKEEHKKRMKGWRDNNSKKMKEINIRYELNNKEKLRKYHKIYDKNNLENKRKRYNILYHNNINFKITELLRKRIISALKNNSKSLKTKEIIGCSVEEFKKHIEKQFLPEFTWENWGNIWELDHILPCASFDLSKENEQENCFYYKNYQPLFKTTNIAESFGYNDQIGNRNKSNKYDQTH
jgi:hypothetical protein